MHSIMSTVGSLASQLINSARFKKEEDEIFFITAQEVSLGHSIPISSWLG